MAAVRQAYDAACQQVKDVLTYIRALAQEVVVNKPVGVTSIRSL